LQLKRLIVSLSRRTNRMTAAETLGYAFLIGRNLIDPVMAGGLLYDVSADGHVPGSPGAQAAGVRASPAAGKLGHFAQEMTTVR
jgi:hypothetical protein